MNDIDIDAGLSFEAAAPVQLTLLEAPINSELDDFVEKALEMTERYPEILTRIEADQIALGLKKKKARLEDQQYIERLTEDLPHFSIEDDLAVPPSTSPLTLHEGRPRMPALLLLVFYLLRGWLKGPKAETFRILIPESQTLKHLYDNLRINTYAVDETNGSGEKESQKDRHR